MVNENLFKSKVVLHGDTMADLAEHLGITRQTLTAKVSNKSNFTQSEIKAVIVRYGLTPDETDEIFFGDLDECWEVIRNTIEDFEWKGKCKNHI